MKKGTFVWISRHPLTKDQRKALKDRGFSNIIDAGDADAFRMSDLVATVAAAVQDVAGVENPAVGVVHPAAALILKSEGFTVAVSRNINRAPEGERPRFEFAGWVFF